MALPQKESTPIFSDATAGTLRLIAYLALAAVLMVLDHRNGWLHRARFAAAAAAERAEVDQPIARVARWHGRGN